MGDGAQVSHRGSAVRGPRMFRASTLSRCEPPEWRWEVGPPPHCPRARVSRPWSCVPDAGCCGPHAVRSRWPRTRLGATSCRVDERQPGPPGQMGDATRRVATPVVFAHFGYLRGAAAAVAGTRHCLAALVGQERLHFAPVVRARGAYAAALARRSREEAGHLSQVPPLLLAPLAAGQRLFRRPPLCQS